MAPLKPPCVLNEGAFPGNRHRKGYARGEAPLGLAQVNEPKYGARYDLYHEAQLSSTEPRKPPTTNGSLFQSHGRVAKNGRRKAGLRTRSPVTPMVELLAGDDGLPADGDVGAWVEDKHRALQAYLNLHAGPRAGSTHRTYIDVFCGSGRAQVRDTRQLVDGSPIAARKCSQRKARLRPPRGRVPRSESSRLGTQLFRNLRARVSGSSR